MGKSAEGSMSSSESAPAPSRKVVCAVAEQCQTNPSAPGRSVVSAAPVPATEPSMSHAQDLASRMAAARPVTWRGAGDLAQIPGLSPPTGAWLVLDLWAGFSGLCIALLSLGMHFYGLAAESSAEARACAQSVMPSLVHVPDVTCVSAEALLPLVHRRKLRGIIVGAVARVNQTRHSI